MNAHTHRPSRSRAALASASVAEPFTGPVRFPGERGYEPVAHGNVRFTARCSCGALRVTNVNAGRREIGPWIVR